MNKPPEHEPHREHHEQRTADIQPAHGSVKPAGAQGNEHSHGQVDSHTGAHSNHADQVDHSGHEQVFRRRFWVCLALSLPVLVFSPQIQEWLGYSTPDFPLSGWIVPVFSVIIFFYGGVPFLQMAVPEIRNREPGMMTLISLAILVAFFYSLAVYFLSAGSTFFWELVTLIDIMLLGHWLEMRSIRQASGALDELARLIPDTAERLSDDGSTTRVPVSKLEKSDRVLVRPGASIPADGEVFDGESAVNESMITGESNPVHKEPGDRVIGGTINGDGSLRVEITATGDETALAGIMRLVEEARKSKSRTQILADRAAGWLFYIAIGVALITAVAWTLAIGLDSRVIARVATVLVIACPHALGLAIPLVIAITTTIGANHGILIRDRTAMERARDLDMVIFDKTGTLTRGEFGVASVQTVAGFGEDQAIALAAAIERDSEHLIARGLRQSADDRLLSLPDVGRFEAIKGRGVKAAHHGQQVYVGGPRLLEMLDIISPGVFDDFERAARSKGQTVIYLVTEGEVKAAFAMADLIRSESNAVIAELHSLGIQVAMLTGDSQAAAESVASELKIDTFFAEVLPEHKGEKVARLQEQGWTTAMVGDGVNDAPALTRADVGIAIGSGTDVAIESAGVILVKNNPRDVLKLIELSKASYRKMLQNLVWATGYNLVALPLAAGILAPFGILLSPALGALLMSLSTVIVAINAQLLRRYRLAG